METSVVKVHDMLSVLSVLAVEKRISKVPGVESVTLNYEASTSLTANPYASVSAMPRRNVCFLLSA